MGDLWVETLVAALVAVGCVLFLARRVKPERFRRLERKMVAGASGLFWGILAAVLFFTCWQVYYSAFYADWVRWSVPLVALFYGAVGLGMWWLAARLPGNPVVTFCVLGGLESVPEHLWGIYRLKILEIPLLHGLKPVPVLVFAVFEYVIYWSVVVVLMVLLQRGWQWWARRGRARTG
jgi:hypothetical protein